MNWQAYSKKWKAKLPFFSEKRLKLIDSIADLPADKDNLLSARVAINEDIKEPQDQKLALRFDFFCEKECEFNNFDETFIRALIGKFKRITDCTASNLPNVGIIRDTLDRGNQCKSYSSLFLLVPPDASIHESELPLAGRFFFFRVQEIIQIVSIETKHRNLN